MATLRSFLAWSVMIPLVSVLGTVLVLGSALSLGRLRVPLVNLLMPVFGRVPLWLLGVRVQVEGWEHVAERRARILVLNHTSLLDLFLFSLVNPPAPCPVAKAEIRWMPPLNLAFWGAGAVFLKRGRREVAVASLQRAGELIRREARTAMISPEGTRSKDGSLLPFKHGPFHLSKQAGAEIVPVVIRGAWALCPPGSMVVRPGTVRIEIMPPLPPCTDPAADALALRERYRRWLAA